MKKVIACLLFLMCFALPLMGCVIEIPVPLEQPSEQQQSTKPEQPVEPEQPAEPKQSTEPEQPSEPKQSTEPEQPSEPKQSTEPEQPFNSDEPDELQESKADFILNTSSKKYHLPSCYHVGRISQENYSEYVGTADELEEKGYVACKTCH